MYRLVHISCGGVRFTMREGHASAADTVAIITCESKHLTVLCECSCGNIDPATGIGTCHDIPQSPLPEECSSQLQAAGGCSAEGRCEAAPCDPRQNGADCPAPPAHYSTCATSTCTNGRCELKAATSGAACVPGLPGGSSTANGVCSGLLCYGPGQCRTDFRDRCPTPTLSCESFSYASSARTCLA